MKSLGFDPGAEVSIAGHDFRIAETTLQRNEVDGSLVVRVFQDEDGAEIITILLRADFLDEAIAQARAREAAA